VKWAQLVELGRELPEVEQGVWYRTPSLQVRGKSFLRLKEDGETVAFLVADAGRQEVLLKDRPDVYFITDHYRGHASVLVRLAGLPVKEARARLEEAWRRKAPRSLVKLLGGERG